MPENHLSYYIDSTTLLDFYLVNTLPALLKLPLRIVTIDIMAADLETPNQDEIRSFGIVIQETPDFVLENMQQTAVKYGITIYDAALLLVCKMKTAVLLSGDRRLRKAAQIEKVHCKGTLWLLEELVLKNVLRAEHAALLLERMFLIGRRLPPDDSSRKIIIWEGGDK
ncbi:MAG: hypothetical protein BWY02_01968 [bacterium ADurb.Bin157]|jgi:predicted nucleic acid-binding protein|nr:hypothetical protein [Candidatus Riflebacteria bacterium]OQB47877.1 MAG: hypothetical protein BWY02_01968 [bacterium ADurb.Bin157]